MGAWAFSCSALFQGPPATIKSAFMALFCYFVVQEAPVWVDPDRRRKSLECSILAPFFLAAG